MGSLILDEADRADRTRMVVLRVVEDINRQLPPSQRLPASLDTILTGPGGKLDSLGLINFIVSAEEQLSAEFGIRVALTDESLGPEVERTFQTVRTVCEHVCRLIAPE